MMNLQQTPSTALPSAWLDVHPMLGISLMDHLWNRLDGAYPHKFRSAFANERAIQNWRESWAEMFDDEQLAPDEVKTGLKRCRTLYDWPPSFAEFLRACRPQLDSRAEHTEACEQMRIRLAGGSDRWSRPQVYWAAVAVGAHDLNALAWEQIRVRWERALSNASGDPVPEFAPALPAPGAQSLTREQAVLRLDALQRACGEINPRDWAISAAFMESRRETLTERDSARWRKILGVSADADARTVVEQMREAA